MFEGAWSFSLGFGDVGEIVFPPTFFPSAAVDSGPALGRPAAVGVCCELVTGCVTAGGEFW